MQLQRNYYEVLGLPPTAKYDEIKRKYRELARKFHPDLVEDKVLGQKVFAQVNAAYRVLGDPERRAQYDATLESTQNRQPVGPGKSVSQNYTVMPGMSSGSNDVTSGERSSAAQAGVQSQATGARPGARPYTQGYQPNPAAMSGDAEAQLSEADAALLAGDPVKATSICKTVLRSNPANGRAYGILGDACMQTKAYDDAERAYQQSLALSPSTVIQGKMSRLKALKAMPNMASASTATRSASETPKGPGQAGKPGGGLLGRILGRK